MAPLFKRLAALRRHARNWQRFSGEEKAVWAEAAVCLCLVRAALWVVPFKTLRQLTGLGGKPNSVSVGDERVRALCALAVQRLARRVPQATCLTQSLVLCILLKRRQEAVRLHLGVAKSDGGKLIAHAWVESLDGKGLTAGGGEGFLPLTHF